MGRGSRARETGLRSGSGLLARRARRDDARWPGFFRDSFRARRGGPKGLRRDFQTRVGEPLGGPRDATLCRAVDATGAWFDRRRGRNARRRARRGGLRRARRRARGRDRGGRGAREGGGVRSWLLGNVFGGGPGFYATAGGPIPAGVTVTPAVGLGGFSLGTLAGGALSGLGLGSIAGMLGGNTTGGAIGGGLGGAIGSFFGPIGTLVGGGLGGLVGGLFGGKPSNYRATATFGPGMAGFDLSGDKPNEQTLAFAQQAAAVIVDQVNQLKAFGVEFRKQVANIWIGQ